MNKQALYKSIMTDVAKIVKTYIIESTSGSDDNEPVNLLFKKMLRFKDTIRQYPSISVQLAAELREILVNDPNISFKDIVNDFNIEDKYPQINLADIKDCYDYISDEEHMYHINVNIEKLIENGDIDLYEKHEMIYANLHLQSNMGKLYEFRLYADNVDDLLIKCKIVQLLGSVKMSNELENAIEDIEIEIEDKWQDRYDRLIDKILISANKSNRNFIDKHINKMIEAILIYT